VAGAIISVFELTREVLFHVVDGVENNECHPDSVEGLKIIIVGIGHCDQTKIRQRLKKQLVRYPNT
jgi:hypothetical protein